MNWTRIISAALISLALIAGSYLVGGRYIILHPQSGELSRGVVRMDRFTGVVTFCTYAAGSNPPSEEFFCGDAKEGRDGAAVNMPTGNSN